MNTIYKGKKFARISKKGAGFFGAFALALTVSITVQAQLSQPQIDSVLSLLESFGVDDSVVTEVHSVLTGESSSPQGQAPAFNFTSDLGLGSSGAEVETLQRWLNANGYEVAATGAGSPGNETTYYGERTRQAVAMYQEENGITPSAGYFGPVTRAAINDDIRDSSPEEPEPTASPSETDSDPGSFDEDDEVELSQEADRVDEEMLGLEDELAEVDSVLLAQPSTYHGEAGSDITLFGAGFTSSNTVYFGDIPVENVAASQAERLTVTVPQDIESGFYELEVENENGVSDGQAFFVVTDEDSVAPQADSVTPQRISYGEEVTIHGSGFDEEWNMIRAPFDIIEGVVSPDGETLTFTVEPFPDTPDLETALEMEDESFEWLMRVYVVNDGGVMSEPAEFILEL